MTFNYSQSVYKSRLVDRKRRFAHFRYVSLVFAHIRYKSLTFATFRSKSLNFALLNRIEMK